MSSKRISVELDAQIIEQLEAQAREHGETVPGLAVQLIEEGLRMERHPGIVFRDGPTGRRAALAHGPDVWEVISAFENPDQLDDAAIKGVAEFAGLKSFE